MSRAIKHSFGPLDQVQQSHVQISMLTAEATGPFAELGLYFQWVVKISICLFQRKMHCQSIQQRVQPVDHRTAFIDLDPLLKSPMQLGQQPPPHNSFGAPLSVEQRALQTFAPPPGMQRPVPPAGIGPNARKADPVTTGSIKSEPKAKGANLLSPKPMAEEHDGPAETRTVFNLPGSKRD